MNRYYTLFALVELTYSQCSCRWIPQVGTPQLGINHPVSVSCAADCSCTDERKLSGYFNKATVRYWHLQVSLLKTNATFYLYYYFLLQNTCLGGIWSTVRRHRMAEEMNGGRSVVITK